MNPQEGKIDWCDWTWNAVTGCLGPEGDGKHCPYCYAAAMARRFKRSFEPEFHEEVLGEPAKEKTPSRIFVVSNGDLFGPGVPDKWILEVLEATYPARWHTYIFLTRHPERYDNWPFPPKALVGATIDGTESSERQEQIMRNLLSARVGQAKRFISFEPLIGPVSDNVMRVIPQLDWMIVGARTGSGNGISCPADSPSPSP